VEKFPGYPFPNGVMIPSVFSVAVGIPAPFEVVPGNSLRVYLSVADASGVGAVVGFGRGIDAFGFIGMALPATGKVEWKWKDVGTVLHLPLFVDDGGGIATLWVEAVENWPAKPTRRARDAFERTRNAEALADLKNRTNAIRQAARMET